MNVEAEQAALGYLQAWLEAHEDGQVGAFGAVGDGKGEIACVRIKVRDVVLRISPWRVEEYQKKPDPNQPGVGGDLMERYERQEAERGNSPGKKETA